MKHSEHEKEKEEDMEGERFGKVRTAHIHDRR